MIAIGFAAAERLRWLAEDVGIPFPMLRDPEYQAYQAFSLIKGSRRANFGLRTAWAYLTLVARKRRYTHPQTDRFQLGGDFVIDGGGIVRFAYRSREPADRPPVRSLVKELLIAAGSTAP